MRTAIITSVCDIPYDDWRDLHARTGRFPFTNPLIFEAWWNHIGQQSDHALHVVTVYHDGRLVAIAPLTVSRYKTLRDRLSIRVLQWAGGNDLGYCDALCETIEAETALWHTIRQSGRYDIGLIKTLHSDSDSCTFVGNFARRVRNGVNYIIDVKWPSSTAWMKEALSSHARKHYRNMENQLKAKAPIKLEIFQKGELPLPVLIAMVEQKSIWAKQHQKSCMFDQPKQTLEMLTTLARAAEAENILHLAWLQAGDAVIATLYSLIQGNVMYLMITSYDIEWYKQSPGRILLLKIFAWAMDHGITKIDLMQGENDYKKGVAELSPVSLNDFTFPGSIWGHIMEPILARTYFNEGPTLVDTFRAKLTNKKSPPAVAPDQLLEIR